MGTLCRELIIRAVLQRGEHTGYELQCSVSQSNMAGQPWGQGGVEGTNSVGRFQSKSHYDLMD